MKLIEIYNENKNDHKMIEKYHNVAFSKDFYDRYKDGDYDIDRMKKLFFEKLNNFFQFYVKYNPDGSRIIDGVDFYKEAKVEYDKIVNGQLFVDKVLQNPDSPLRNIIQIMHVDEFKLKQKNLNENPH